MEKYTNLNGEQRNAIEEIKDLIFQIAWSNKDFVCTQCLSTIDKLFAILTQLTGTINQEFYDEIQAIIGG